MRCPEFVAAILLVAAMGLSGTGVVRAQPAPTATGSETTSAEQPPPAVDPGAAEKCTHAFSAAQKLRRESKLIAAAAELSTCSQPSCPAIVNEPCRRWLREVREATPSVAITAKDPAGKDTVAVQIYVDGQLRASQLTGKPLLLDPGPHTIRLHHGQATPIEQKIVATEGEKARVIAVQFVAPETDHPTPPIDDEPAGVSPWVYVGFGVGAAGLLVGTITGIVTLTRSSSLEDECPEYQCPADKQSELDSAFTLAHVSTAGFVVGGVGVAVGVLALLVGGSSKPDDSHQSGVSVQPLVGLGTVGLSGRF